MTKKHEMTEQEHRIYKKQHAYADAVDAEQEKIKREKAAYVQNRRSGQRQLQQNLLSATNTHDIEAMEENLELPEEEQIAERVLRNAHTHKKRLIGLRKHEAVAAAGAHQDDTNGQPSDSQ